LIFSTTTYAERPGSSSTVGRPRHLPTSGPRTAGLVHAYVDVFPQLDRRNGDVKNTTAPAYDHWFLIDGQTPIDHIQLREGPDRGNHGEIQPEPRSAGDSTSKPRRAVSDIDA
jgi:hypothetical protein